jgi:hypothetical protein
VNYGVYGEASGGNINWGGYFNGDVFTTGTYQPSDIKLKENIQILKDATKTIMSLKPTTYTFRNDSTLARLNLPRGKQIGLIVDDVEKILPDLVKVNDVPAEFDMNTKQKILDEINFKVLNYTELIPLLIGAFQEQQLIIQKQQSEIEKLQIEINKLKK